MPAASQFLRGRCCYVSHTIKRWVVSLEMDVFNILQTPLKMSFTLNFINFNKLFIDETRGLQKTTVTNGVFKICCYFLTNYLSMRPVGYKRLLLQTVSSKICCYFSTNYLSMRPVGYKVTNGVFKNCVTFSTNYLSMGLQTVSSKICCYFSTNY